MVEILKVKTAYLFHPPYLFLGALCNDATYGGSSLSEAKKFVQCALAERDAALLAGKRSELHRVTVLLSVGENNECKIALEQFAASPVETLRPEAKYILEGYADGSVISRRVEATHSHIKGHQKRATHCTPVFVNAALKSGAIAARLEVNADFFGFCTSQWNRRNLLKQVIEWTLPIDRRWTIATMNNAAKRKWIWLYDPDAQHRDVTKQSVVAKSFKAACTSMLTPPPIAAKMNAPCEMLVGLVKSKFSEPQSVWSVPSAFLQRSEVVSPGPNVLDAVSALVECHGKDPVVDVNEIMFFRVTEAGLPGPLGPLGPMEPIGPLGSLF